jgi:hypothetical protein
MCESQCHTVTLCHCVINAPRSCVEIFRLFVWRHSGFQDGAIAPALEAVLCDASCIVKRQRLLRGPRQHVVILGQRLRERAEQAAANTA